MVQFFHSSSWNLFQLLVMVRRYFPVDSPATDAAEFVSVPTQANKQIERAVAVGRIPPLQLLFEIIHEEEHPNRAPPASQPFYAEPHSTNRGVNIGPAAAADKTTDLC